MIFFLLQITAAPDNTFSQLDQAIDALFTTQAALVPLAVRWGYFFAMLQALLFLWNAMMHAVEHHEEMILVEGVPFMCSLVFVSTALRYIAAPIPGVGLAWPDLFTAMGRQIADVIGMATLDILLQQISDCWNGLQQPPAWNLPGLFVYFLVLILMGLLDGALFFVTILGYFAIGLGKVFASAALVMYLAPGWRQKFWNWVNFMWNYGMYRATAAAVVLIVATFLVNFFQRTIHQQYDVAHFYGLLLFIILAIPACIVLLLKTPHFNNELWGGGLGHAGADFGAQFSSSMRTLILMSVRKG